MFTYRFKTEAEFMAQWKVTRRVLYSGEVVYHDAEIECSVYESDFKKMSGVELDDEKYQEIRSYCIENGRLFLLDDIDLRVHYSWFAPIFRW